jgi:hypothetical protein
MSFLGSDMRGDERPKEGIGVEEGQEFEGMCNT